MSGNEPKKLAIIRMLHILQEYSDRDHPMTQAAIIDRLEKDYGITLERKAVSSNISLLKEAGYDIQSDKSGSYLVNRVFTDAELRYVIDGILGSRHISSALSKDMIHKVCSLSNKWFQSRVRHIYSVNEWNKTENQSVFTNIALIDEAISRGLQIRYQYNKFGADKKLHKSSSQQISPYQMILHNQRYYVMGHSAYWDHIVFHKLDRITNMMITEETLLPIRKIPGYENGIDYKAIDSSAYMYTDKPEMIVFTADTRLIDQIVDWFGRDISIDKINNREDRIQVVLRTSPNAMHNWALQYLDFIEIKSPRHLRESILESIQKGIEKYQ